MPLLTPPLLPSSNIPAAPMNQPSASPPPHVNLHTPSPRWECQSGGAPALRPGAIAQSPGREAALAWASLAQRFPASGVFSFPNERLCDPPHLSFLPQVSLCDPCPHPALPFLTFLYSSGPSDLGAALAPLIEAPPQRPGRVTPGWTPVVPQLDEGPETP